MATQKPRKALYLFLSLAAAFFLAFASFYFYISSTYTPEKVRQLILEQAAVKYPAADLSIEKLDFEFGSRFYLLVNKVNIKDKFKNSILKSENVRVSIPFLSILTKSGQIEIDISRPELFLQELQSGNNWTATFTDSKKKNRQQKLAPEKTIKNETSGTDSSSEVLKKISLSLKVTNAKFVYQDMKKSIKKIGLEKVLLKNIGIANNIAFEIRGGINLPSQVAAKLLAIGEIDLKNYSAKGSIPASISLKVSDLQVPSFKGKLPLIKTSFDMMFLNDQLKGSGELSADDHTGTQFKFSASKKEIRLYEILGKFKISDYSRYIGPDSLPQDLDIREAIIRISGSIRSKGEVVLPKINLAIDSLKVRPPVGGEIKQSISVLLLSKKLRVEAVSELFSGLAKTNVNMLLNKDFSPNTKSPIKVSTLINGVNVPEALVEKIVKAQQKAKSEESKINDRPKTSIKGQAVKTHNKNSNAPSLGQSSLAPSLPKFSYQLEVTNSVIAKGPFSLKALVVGGGQKVNIKKMNIGFLEGSTTGPTEVNLFPKGELSLKSNLILKDMNIDGLRPFIPMKVNDIQGIFSGKLKGTMDLRKKLDYDLYAEVTGRNGRIKGLVITDHVQNVIKGLSFLKGKVPQDKEFKVSERFSEIRFQGVLRPEDISVHSLRYTGINNKVRMTASGRLYPATEKEGQLNLTFQDLKGKTTKDIKKYTGIGHIPVLLKGIGSNLRPVYEFTTKKLLKGYYKVTGKKKAKKARKKLEKKGKKELKKLFKKIF